MTNRIKLSPVEGASTFEVIEPFLFIEKGFVFDGASIPWFLHWLICPFDPRYIEEYALHDYCYRTGYLSREASDNLLRDRLIRKGMGKTKANLIYLGVTTFGEMYYNNQKD